MMGESTVDASRQKAAKLYSTKRWRRLRARLLRESPMCVCPTCKGAGLEADTVDHITPHRGDLRLFWDTRNLQTLAKPCHDSWKQKQEGGRGYDPLKGSDESGQPINPDHPWYEER